MTILVIAILWLTCAVLAASIFLGYFQNKFPIAAKDGYREDLSAAWGFGLFFGPIGLVMLFFLTGFIQYGLMNPFILNKYKN